MNDSVRQGDKLGDAMYHADVRYQKPIEGRCEAMEIKQRTYQHSYCPSMPRSSSNRSYLRDPLYPDRINVNQSVSFSTRSAGLWEDLQERRRGLTTYRCPTSNLGVHQLMRYGVPKIGISIGIRFFLFFDLTEQPLGLLRKVGASLWLWIIYALLQVPGHSLVF